ncbi:MAG: hypothetical protein ING19_07280 [Azospirillum sp.]|nr:hypothetical protein [Azospirillum sp.]
MAFPGDVDGDNLPFDARIELLSERAGATAAELRARLRPGFDRVAIEQRVDRQWAARNGLAQVGYYLPAVPVNLALFARHVIGTDQSFFLHYSGGSRALNAALNVGAKVTPGPDGRHAVAPVGAFAREEVARAGYFAETFGIETDRIAALKGYAARLEAAGPWPAFVTLDRKPDGLEAAGMPGDSPSQLTPLSAAHSELVYRVQTDRTRLAVLAFRYDRNWRFEIAGRRLETVEVDGFWLGVVVPPSDGELSGRYVPKFAGVFLQGFGGRAD